MNIWYTIYKTVENVLKSMFRRRAVNKKTDKTKEKFTFKTFFLLTLAGIINAIGVTMFLAPVKLYDSGISGTSILLSQITPDYLSLSFFLLLLNVPLFLYGYKRQGPILPYAPSIRWGCIPWRHG